MEVEERRLAIFQVADGVGEDDRVEWAVKPGEGVGLLDIAGVELQMRVPALGMLDHGRTEIQAHPGRWPESGYKITSSAPDIEHAKALGHQAPHVRAVGLVEVA